MTKTDSGAYESVFLDLGFPVQGARMVVAEQDGAVIGEMLRAFRNGGAGRPKLVALVG
jgi:hypothetical protein